MSTLFENDDAARYFPSREGVIGNIDFIKRVGSAD
jgi:hypothetical protein